jgi:hypothetical protein
MAPDPVIFNLRVSTIPLLNVRIEFNRNRRILAAADFRARISRWRFGDPIHAEYVIWGGEPSSLLTWFLQRAIIGAEAYVPSAVVTAAVHYGRLSADVVNATKGPFSVRSGGVANRLYNHLPGLVESDFRMKRARGSLWKNVRRFYEEVRNPLFHGSQLYTDGHQHGDTLDAVLRAFDLFVETYEWVDWWLPPRLLDVTGSIPISEPPRLVDG